MSLDNDLGILENMEREYKKPQPCFIVVYMGQNDKVLAVKVEQFDDPDEAEAMINAINYRYAYAEFWKHAEFFNFSSWYHLHRPTNVQVNLHCSSCGSKLSGADFMEGRCLSSGCGNPTECRAVEKKNMD